MSLQDIWKTKQLEQYCMHITVLSISTIRILINGFIVELQGGIEAADTEGTKKKDS